MTSRQSLAAIFGCMGLAALLLAVPSTAAQKLGADQVLVHKPEQPLEANLERVLPEGGAGGGLTVGPDVTIIDLSGVNSYNSGGGQACPPGYGPGNCRGFSVGTNSCGRGTHPVDWCDATDDCRETTDEYHPFPATNTDFSVIGQNMYRLKDGRFEQIGASFLKHGFVSTNSSNPDCTWNDDGVENSSCVTPPAFGDQLGLGCTDFYGAGLNGSRPLGRRSDANGANGDHPRNEAGGEEDDNYDQRIVVRDADLDPALNPGALYWMEGQYVVRDDARAGNGLNNASYRAATVGAQPSLTVSMTGPTFREVSAIHAWPAADPEVELVFVDRDTFFVGDPLDPPLTGNHPDHTVTERFEAARRVYDQAPLGGPLQYRYEYAIHNLNSDTSADGFVVSFPGSATFANVGFTDVDHHSGEPYDTADWSISVDEPNGTITWSAVDVGANTNALRWGTTFSFYFESDQPPTSMSHQLDLFKAAGTLPVVFDGGVIFEDGFESGDTGAWSTVTP